MTSELDTTDIAAIREGRLESFLDRPLFEETNRRAAALAGVLVGQVSWHQDSVRNIGRPLDSGTKGDQLTKNSLENVLTAALEKAKVYAQDSDKSYDRDLLFPETVDRLLEETEEMPSDWTIEKRELQFCYVLGHAHGRRSMPVAFDLHESEDDKRSEPTADEPVTN
jgi:CRISPR-associated protein Cas8b/Csh1 subtype I-B